ncbi:glycine receptor subunit alpha-2-like isoform X2 [Ostrea edulis]|uniref:glycine receptor subunit alpha-2-like isoform X2 n=2 Tax=Ostrea edulis TaxID=37623 RepID=UPI002095D14F|nr:glycine receptor subunit alpha-2-like isoform X2 [Ostrea edulis]
MWIASALNPSGRQNPVSREKKLNRIGQQAEPMYRPSLPNTKVKYKEMEILLTSIGVGFILSAVSRPVTSDITVFSNARSYAIYFLCMVAMGYAANAREEILKEIFTGYDGKIPPNYDNDTPVNSSVQLYIISIDSINEAKMDFSMSFFLRQRWIDNRMNYTPTFNMTRLELDTRRMADVWVPDLYFVNEKKADVHDVTVPNKLMHIYPNGLIVYSMRVTGVFTCNMDLQKYPLDDQTCKIDMESYGYSTETLVMRWHPSPVETSEGLQLPQFELQNITEYICDVTYAGVTYTCLRLEFKLHRTLGFYIIQVYVPSCLIVILSWVSFWLNVDSTPARISLGLLTVLTMTTQSSGAKASLPRVSYVKAIDIWMSTCLLFVFAALIEFAYVNVLARVEQRRGRSVTSQLNETKEDQEDEKESGKLWCFRNLEDRERARLVDKISRVVFPAVFIVFNIIYWLVYVFWEPD